MSFITTTFGHMKQQPPKADHGRNLVVIGTSDKGNNYELEEFVGSYEQAEELFGGGSLLEAYEELVLAGAKYIHLLKIEDNTPESFKTGLDAISDYPMNIVVPAGIYFDSDSDEGKSYASVLAEFCSRQLNCIGVMGVTPFSRQELEAELKTELQSEYGDQFPEWRKQFAWKEFIARKVKEKALSLISTPKLSYLSSIGSFINVVFSTVYCFNGTRETSGHTLYAALISNLYPGISPVNKSLPCAEELLFDAAEIYTEDGQSIRDVLDKFGFVTFSSFVLSGISPASAATMATKKGLKNVHNVRVMQDISWYIRMIGEELIGEPLYRKTQVLDSQIREYLAAYTSVGILRSYDMFINVSTSDIEVNIDLDFIDAVKVQNITIKLPSL